MEEKWLTAEEAAKYLGISITNLYSLAQSNRIPAHRVGKMWRFQIAELDKWIKANKSIDEFFASLDFKIEDNLLLRDPQKEAYLAARSFFEKGNKKALIQL